jgi:hypothetical protein
MHFFSFSRPNHAFLCYFGMFTGVINQKYAFSVKFHVQGFIPFSMVNSAFSVVFTVIAENSGAWK